MKQIIQGLSKLCVGIIGAAIFCLVLIQNDQVREVLGKAIADTVRYKTGWTIKVDKIQGVFPFYFSIYGLSFQNSEGSKTSIDQTDIQFYLWGVDFQLSDPQIPGELEGSLGCRPFSGEVKAHVLLLIEEKFPIEISAECSSSWNQWACFIQCPETLIKGDCQLINNSRIVCDNLLGSAFQAHLSGNIEYDLTKQFLTCETSLESPRIPTTALKVIGPIAQPEISLKSSSPLFHVEEFAIEKFTAQANGSIEDGHLTLKWLLEADIQNIPIAVTVRTNTSRQTPFDIPEVFVSLPSGSLSGALFLNQSGIKGALAGKIQDLSKIHPLLQGNADIRIDTSKSHDLLVVQASDIRYEDWTCEKLTIQQNSSNPFQDFNGYYSLTAQNVSYRNFFWTEMSCSTTLDLSRKTWPFALTATGKKIDQTEINASGSWHWSQDEYFVHCGILSGAFLGYRFELQNPINLLLSEELIRTSLISIEIDEGKLTFEGKIEKNELNCLLDIKHIPAAIANSWLPKTVDVSGDMSLFLRLTGPQEDIQGSMVLKGKELKIHEKDFSHLPISEARVEAVLANNLLKFEGSLLNTLNPIDIQGEIPLAISLYPIRFALNPERPLKARLATSGEVAPYLQLFVTDTTNVQGHVDINIDIGGTTNQPVVNGSFTVTNGLFESLNTGFVVKDIACTLRGNDRKLLLTHFSGNDGANGSVKAEGEFFLDPKNDFPFELRVDLEETVLARLAYANMTASGNVTLKGSQKGGHVAGDLTVDNAVMEIPKQLPVQMKTVEVTYINEPEEAKTTAALNKKTPWPIELDLHFQVPSNVFVNGRDLESEWQGEFTITGTTLDQNVRGTLQLIRGEYSFNGNSFVSHQGSVNFAGDLAAKTTLYVVGEQQIDNIKIQAILKGDLTDPSLSFRSNPTMSQKEILAWILFGHGIDEMTPSQTDQLSQSVFTLSSGQDDPDVLSRLTKKMGIDRLDLSRGGSEDFNELSLKLGKYISRGIYVSLSKSINAEANQVAIEANLTRHLKVQAEVGDNAEGKMSLKWARDY